MFERAKLSMFSIGGMIGPHWRVRLEC